MRRKSWVNLADHQICAKQCKTIQFSELQSITFWLIYSFAKCFLPKSWSIHFCQTLSGIAQKLDCGLDSGQDHGLDWPLPDLEDIL